MFRTIVGVVEVVVTAAVLVSVAMFVCTDTSDLDVEEADEVDDFEDVIGVVDEVTRVDCMLQAVVTNP